MRLWWLCRANIKAKALYSIIWHPIVFNSLPSEQCCMLFWLSVDFYPHAFLKKRRGYCNRVRLSVHPLCYRLLNHRTKFNQTWCVSYWHEWGVQRQTFFGPAPWGPGEGSKSQISFNFNYKVKFKDVYTKFCVCPHKWKIQNISDGIFILSPGSCPRGGT